jgi:hypothetical protein
MAGSTSRRKIAAFLVLCSLAVPGSAADTGRAPLAPTDRTVYVTVTDNRGAPITDLTAADFVVKEGGKERQVTKAEPASPPIHLTLAVEERLIGDGPTRMALFELMKRLSGAAEIRLMTIGIRNNTVADYTSDLNTLVGAINQFTLNPNPDSNLVEGVLEIANHYAGAKRARPVLVLVALSGGQAGVDPRNVLDRVRDSGVLMHAVTLSGGAGALGPVGSLGDQSGREQVLGDGPGQSGGRRIDVNTTAAFQKALQQVASDLLAQYAITYSLPDGVKPDKRVSISTKRRGVSLRAPSAVPDR